MTVGASSYYDKTPAAAERYDALTAPQTDDVAFYLDEALRSRGPVLEVGCGTARVALAIAAAGIETIGIDRSPHMLAVAAAKRREADATTRARLRLIRADMRSFALQQRFDRVLMPFRVLQSMIEVEDQLAALACCREALAPEGRLVFNVFDPRYDLLSTRLTPNELVETGRGYRDGHGQVVEKWTGWYDPVRQVLRGTFVYEREARGEVVERIFEPLVLRYFFRYEIEHLLARSGYEIEALYGGWQREPYQEHGQEMIWIARKAG